jgi:hypothetical protein
MFDFLLKMELTIILRGGRGFVSECDRKVFIPNDRELNFKDGDFFLFRRKVKDQIENADLPPDSDHVRPHF